MSLSKYQLFNDVDSIASWLNDGSGNAISSTGGALDVNVASGDLSVDLDHTEDSVRLGDGTNFLTSTTVGADIGLDVNLINASIVVTATDLDIRDLAFASDSVTAHQGGTWTIDSITNDVNVTATDLDIRDLSAAQDSIESWVHDGSGNAINSTSNALNVYVDNELSVKPEGFASGAYGANAVNTTASLLTAGTSGRDKVLIQNLGNQSVWLGFDNSVTASNGIELVKGGSYEMELSDGVTLYGITSSGSADIRYQELVA